jgi:DNA mismatch endonuclease (patch repair protein)
MLAAWHGWSHIGRQVRWPAKRATDGAVNDPHGHGMVDTLTPEERGRRMALIRSSNTKPEMRVRKLLWGMGFRYRLHATDLPGKPDIVFRGRKKAILVHGCFWHLHGCAFARMPKSRQDFWSPKLQGNKIRDAQKLGALIGSGWDVLVVWECEMKDEAALSERLKKFLDANDI